MRPQIAQTVRTLGRRANSSKSVDKAVDKTADKAKAVAQDVIENPQVQKAVAQANQAYAQGAAAVQRVAGPIGDKVGNMLGGECWFLARSGGEGGKREWGCTLEWEEGARTARGAAQGVGASAAGGHMSWAAAVRSRVVLRPPGELVEAGLAMPE